MAGECVEQVFGRNHKASNIVEYIIFAQVSTLHYMAHISFPSSTVDVTRQCGSALFAGRSYVLS